MSLPRPLAARATLRLTAVVAAAVAALSLAVMALTHRLVEVRMTEGVRATLAADLDGLAALYDQRRIVALREAIAYRAALDPGGEMLLLMDRGGRVLAGTRADWPAGLPRLPGAFSASGAVEMTEGGTRWLAVARELPGGFPLLVARSLAPLDATLAALGRAMGGLALAIVAVAAGVGWLAARATLGRIGRLNALADRVAAGDLAARLPGPRGDDEFGLLETHVHAMLDRIEALNRETHRLSDTIAHEMRTPLTRMLPRLDALPEGDPVADGLRADIRDAVRVFDSLLDISRAEADRGHGGGLVPLDLSALAGEMWELYAPLAEEAGLQARAEIAPGLRVLGDRGLIARMLANLFDNAIKYCRPGDALTLTLAAGERGGRHAMRVADTGPGLPPDLGEGAFDRFTRGARDRGVAGHGLGLALVRAIALRHGARLRIAPGGPGFALEIGWPVHDSGG